MSRCLAFDGRTVAVIGAASDMGLAVARHFGEAGAEIFLGDLDLGRLDGHAHELRGLGLAPRIAPVDVTAKADVDRFIDAAWMHRERIDVLVNLAGVIVDVEALDMDEAELDRVLAVNLKGTLFGCQAAGRKMAAAGAGAIVNTASMGAFTAIPKLSAYSMSKAAVVALTRTLALELAPAGVRVNAVAPGYIEGGMTWRHLRDADGRADSQRVEEATAKAKRRNPLGLTGTPDDVAHAVAYLASDAARYVTGQVLHTNGGAYLP